MCPGCCPTQVAHLRLHDASRVRIDLRGGQRVGRRKDATVLEDQRQRHPLHMYAAYVGFECVYVGQAPERKP